MKKFIILMLIVLFIPTIGFTVEQYARGGGGRHGGGGHHSGGGHHGGHHYYHPIGHPGCHP